ncbi:MAG: HD domain-containing protein [Caldilineaceae bacterium]
MVGIGSVAGAGYRVRQFWHGLRAQVQPEELTTAATLLPTAALAKFQQLPADAQRHSLNVLQTLPQEELPADLAAAALLHDIGKLAAQEASVPINLWWRGPLVILDAFPGVLTRLASPTPTASWRYRLYVHLMHPQLGAVWAKSWGCTPLTCWLIEHHQDDAPAAPNDEARRLLRLLQWADSKN